VGGHLIFHRDGVGNPTFGVADFKSIGAAQLVPRNLTVLCGANSSGKSSLLQAVLFFAQSFGQASVVINGDLVRLGEGIDVIKDGTDSTTVEVQFDVEKKQEGEEEESTERHRLRLTFDSPPGRAGLSIAALSLWIEDSCLLDVVRTSKRPEVDAFPNAEVLAALRGDEDEPDTYLFVSGVTPVQFAYRVSPAGLAQLVYKVLERNGSGRYNILEELLANADDPADIRQLQALHKRFTENEIISSDDPALAGVFDRYAEFLVPDDWLTAPIAVTTAGPGMAQMRFGLFGVNEYIPDELARIVEELVLAFSCAQQIAEQTIYLGPLRDDPRVAYPLGHTVRGLPVGEKGEFTAAYLLDHGTDVTKYGSPGGQQRTTTLRRAVIDWCEYLGIADAVEVEPMGKMGHQLRLKVGGTLRDPTAIGVGASQLLPVVALVLGADAGAIVLMEQPELHLHPKVQSRLADFLIRARPDVRLVIETHSENLITRLRLRVAEQQVQPEDISVLFASQKPVDGAEGLYTEFRALSIDELGDFDFWPQDFFDSLDQDASALAKAVAASMRAKRPQDSD
jgi:AAA domain, putative AbiEii toxin, Type IV TA system/Protein of unknown function (DUF3696)